MKKIISLMTALILVLGMAVSASAEELERPIIPLEGKTAAEIDEITMETLKNSITRENQRLNRFFAEDDATDLDLITPVKGSDYGIHAATRYIYGRNYREIQTRFYMGDNINATDGAAVYFMHYFGGHGLNLDSGIFYKHNHFSIFNSGDIIDPKDNDHWDDDPLPDVYPGDIVYVNTKVTSTHMITTVKKNGDVIGTLVDPLVKTIGTPRFNIAREFNIASTNPISNTDNYFSWSDAQSTLTTTSNNLVQMSADNSWLGEIKYDITEPDADHIGCVRESYSSGGYIYDRVWCRCNFR